MHGDKVLPLLFAGRYIYGCQVGVCVVNEECTIEVALDSLSVDVVPAV